MDDAPARRVSAARARWVTVFNGARDGYQCPLALAEAGALEALVTDWYSPFDRPWFARAAAAAPAGVRSVLARRYRPGLPSTRVESRLWDAARQRLTPGGLAAVDARLGRHAGELARRRGAHLLAYSFYAHAAFAAYGADAGRRAIFQVQAHPAAMRRVLLEELDAARDAEARGALARDPDVLGTSPRYAELAEEPLLADRCVVPSTYVRSTLVEAGVAAERIAVVPYGVDLDAFVPRAPGGAEGARVPFRVTYAGQLVRRKGLGYLLEAWRRLARPDAELLLVGRGAVDEALLARHAGRYRLVQNVHSRARMAELFASTDVCCLPSLSDSFGHVLLEAMACGTPVVGTVNTAAPDLVTPGRDGFVVPVRDADALAEVLGWCHAHRDALAAMRPVARQRAEAFSWASFRRRLRAELGVSPEGAERPSAC